MSRPAGDPCQCEWDPGEYGRGGYSYTCDLCRSFEHHIEWLELLPEVLVDAPPAVMKSYFLLYPSWGLGEEKLVSVSFALGDVLGDLL